MHIHLLHQSAIEGKALSVLITKEGYQTSFSHNDFPKPCPEKSSLLLIDTDYVSSLDFTQIAELCENNRRIILLGNLNDLHWFFEFPCNPTGFLHKKGKVCNLYRAIEKIYNGEAFLSPAVLDFFQKPEVEQQAILFEKKLRRHLTRTELKVLGEIVQNKTTEEIAEEWHRSIHTISNHRKSIKRKLGITGNYSLIRFCSQKADSIRTLVEISSNENGFKKK